MVLGSNSYMARFLAISFLVLACAMEAAQRAEGQSQIGQCLIECGQKTGSCVVDCGISKLIPFSAFWLRSSVVSVLISLISD
ncbi:hypothetical protein MIMGU_mgv1a025933mg, partial [Erythranthe guttata]